MIRRRKKKQEIVQPRPRDVLFEFTSEDEDYVNMMLKKSAMRTLRKHRKTAPRPEEPVPIDPEIDKLLTQIEKKVGIQPDSVKPIKNCRKCYFSKSLRVIGTDWYCQCSNVAKSSGKLGWTWVHCESNLPCWRVPDT
ncbi:MAG: hypothetical protein ACW98Y_12775 [Candidatus Thorarchaeota archaeon]